MATCDTTLLADASCLTCLNDQQLLAIIACQLASLNGMSCSTTLLSDASCLTCLNPQQLLAIIACQVSLITGGIVVAGRQVYDSNNLPAAPADPTKGAIAYPYTGGGGGIKEWDVTNQVWV